MEVIKWNEKVEKIFKYSVSETRWVDYKKEYEGETFRSINKQIFEHKKDFKKET